MENIYFTMNCSLKLEKHYRRTQPAIWHFTLMIIRYYRTYFEKHFSFIVSNASHNYTKLHLFFWMYVIQNIRLRCVRVHLIQIKNWRKKYILFLTWSWSRSKIGFACWVTSANSWLSTVTWTDDISSSPSTPTPPPVCGCPPPNLAADLVERRVVMPSGAGVGAAWDAPSRTSVTGARDWWESAKN